METPKWFCGTAAEYKAASDFRKAYPRQFPDSTRTREKYLDKRSKINALIYGVVGGVASIAMASYSGHPIFSMTSIVATSVVGGLCGWWGGVSANLIYPEWSKIQELMAEEKSDSIKIMQAAADGVGKERAQEMSMALSESSKHLAGEDQSKANDLGWAFKMMAELARTSAEKMISNPDKAKEVGLSIAGGKPSDKIEKGQLTSRLEKLGEDGVLGVQALNLIERSRVEKLFSDNDERDVERLLTGTLPKLLNIYERVPLENRGDISTEDSLRSPRDNFLIGMEGALKIAGDLRKNALKRISMEMEAEANVISEKTRTLK